MKNQSIPKSNTQNNKAIAYIRASKKEQADKGYSFEIQNKAISIYAENNNLDLTFTFEEKKPASTVYNKKSNDNVYTTYSLRPELNKMLDYIMRNKIPNLIVYSRDRLTRDFEQYISLNYFFTKNNITLHYAKLGENISTENDKINRFLEIIFANVSEFEANVISSRVKCGNKSCVLQGYWPGGKAPFGYNLENISLTSKRKSKLQKNNIEAAIVKEIFELYCEGFGYRKIADKMNSKYKNIQWTKIKIERIIKNETYTGNITWNRHGGRRHPYKYENIVKSDFIEDACIVQKNKWLKTNTLRQKKIALKDPKYYTTPFLLKDKLICPKCEKKLRCKNYGKDKKSVYRCPTKINSKSELIIEKTSIENIVLKELNNIIENQNIDKSWNFYKKRASEEKIEITNLIDYTNKEIIKIKEFQSNINDMINKNLPKEIASKFNDKNLQLSKAKKYYSEHKENLEKELKYNFFNSKKEFRNKIISILKSNITFNRMVIDILIDHIDINITADNLSVDIYIIPPKDFL